jgi:hypothetical protein
MLHTREGERAMSWGNSWRRDQEVRRRYTLAEFDFTSVRIATSSQPYPGEHEENLRKKPRRAKCRARLLLKKSKTINIDSALATRAPAPEDSYAV